MPLPTQPVIDYLQDLHNARATGGAGPETSFYPQIANLLNAIGAGLKPNVLCIINPSNRGEGIPDAALYTADQLQRGGEPLPGATPARGVAEFKPLKR